MPVEAEPAGQGSDDTCRTTVLPVKAKAGGGRPPQLLLGSDVGPNWTDPDADAGREARGSGRDAGPQGQRVNRSHLQPAPHRGRERNVLEQVDHDVNPLLSPVVEADSEDAGKGLSVAKSGTIKVDRVGHEVECGQDLHQ